MLGRREQLFNDMLNVNIAMEFNFIVNVIVEFIPLTDFGINFKKYIIPVLLILITDLILPLFFLRNRQLLLVLV